MKTNQKNQNSNPVDHPALFLGKSSKNTDHPVDFPVDRNSTLPHGTATNGPVALALMPEPDPVPAPLSLPQNGGAAALALATAAQALLAAIQTLQQPGAVATPGAALTLSPAPAPVGAALPTMPAGCMTVSELINDLLKTKARSGRSDRYLSTLKSRLGSFQRGRGQAAIANITTADVERWLGAQDWSKKTANNHLTDVRTMFNYAIKRGYLATTFNPARGAEAISNGVGAGEIEIHTPEQVAKVLETARAVDLDVMRHLAVRYFAGVRTKETLRLTETNIKLEHGVIEVPAAKAKTASRRLVTITPALAAWLALGGTLKPMSEAQRIRPVIRQSGVPWVHNAARHSFVSYHLGRAEKDGGQNCAATALQAGTSEAKVFSNYRALVTPKQAAAFWAIRPKS